jgi:hypothetical protein
MKILSLTTPSGIPYLVVARDKAEELAAYLHIFNVLDRVECYSGCSPYVSSKLPLARKGDAEAAKLIVLYRSRIHCEYERVDAISAIVP